MGYGTILSPTLIILGFPALAVIPAILLTQGIGGFTASIFHHKHGNASFSLTTKSKNPIYILKKVKEHGIISAVRNGFSEDLRVVIIITSLGVFAAVFAAFVAINISKQFLNLYIGLLVTIMGILVISGFRFRYTLRKLFLVGLVSAFNKVLSGGGFGPVVTGGQMVLGKDHKKAIACTTASEPLIVITGFIIYLLLKEVSGYGIIIALAIGSILAAPVGPLTTKKIDKDKLKKIVALLMMILGLVMLLKVMGIIKLGVSI